MGVISRKNVRNTVDAAALSGVFQLAGPTLDAQGQPQQPRLEKPIIQQGHVEVPEVAKKHLREPGYFEPTPGFNKIKLMKYHTAGRWPHFDGDGKWCDNCVSYQ
ncbi:MAG: hypothetical protein NTW28_08390 [Candidatus Solibacter sp.]|nr:hypothetical protein [Candidatus Solibacter sp.]